jgi:hypothetical protein
MSFQGAGAGIGCRVLDLRTGGRNKVGFANPLGFAGYLMFLNVAASATNSASTSSAWRSFGMPRVFRVRRASKNGFGDSEL